jgi:ERCC4-type nuclease
VNDQSKLRRFDWLHLLPVIVTLIFVLFQGIDFFGKNKVSIFPNQTNNVNSSLSGILITSRIILELIYLTLAVKILLKLNAKGSSKNYKVGYFWIFFLITLRIVKNLVVIPIFIFQYKYSIPVIQTAHIGETAILINAIDKYYEEDPTNFQRSLEPLKITDAIHVQKKANAADTKHFAIACLSQCPGVSVKMAEAILSNYSSLENFLNASEEEIASLKHGTRKVGPAVAKRLYMLCHSPFN